MKNISVDNLERLLDSIEYWLTPTKETAEKMKDESAAYQLGVMIECNKRTREHIKEIRKHYGLNTEQRDDFDEYELLKII